MEEMHASCARETAAPRSSATATSSRPVEADHIVSVPASSPETNTPSATQASALTPAVVDAEATSPFAFAVYAVGVGEGRSDHRLRRRGRARRSRTMGKRGIVNAQTSTAPLHSRPVS
jgi:hypothetical protein